MGMDQYIVIEAEGMVRCPDCMKMHTAAMQIEICYWRKYYDLHEFITTDSSVSPKKLCSEEGMFEAELSAEDLNTVRKFVKDPQKYGYSEWWSETADDKFRRKMKKKWDLAIKNCIELVTENNKFDFNPHLKIIYKADW